MQQDGIKMENLEIIALTFLLKWTEMISSCIKCLHMSSGIEFYAIINIINSHIITIIMILIIIIIIAYEMISYIFILLWILCYQWWLLWCQLNFHSTICSSIRIIYILVCSGNYFVFTPCSPLETISKNDQTHLKRKFLLNTVKWKWK